MTICGRGQWKWNAWGAQKPGGTGCLAQFSEGLLQMHILIIIIIIIIIMRQVMAYKCSYKLPILYGKSLQRLERSCLDNNDLKTLTSLAVTMC